MKCSLALLNIFFISILASCGGGSEEIHDRTFILGVAEPAELFALSSSERDVSVNLESTELPSTTTPLTWDEARNVYYALISDLVPGAYSLEVTIEIKWTDTTDEPSSEMYLPVVRYDGQITIVEGQTDIVVDLAPSEWLIDLDDDLDGVSNLNEILSNTHPLDEDTDADGIDDFNDNCPALANPDQIDGDQDGLGDLCDQVPGALESVT